MGLYSDVNNSIYIHYQPAHVVRYTTQKGKTDLVERITNDARIKSMMVKALAKTDNITLEEEQAYFDFLGGFGENNNTLKTALESALANNTSNLFSLKSSFSGQFAKYDNFYDAFNQVLQHPDVRIYSDINQQINKLLLQLQQGGIFSVNEAIINDKIAEAIALGVFRNDSLAVGQSNSKIQSTLYTKLKNIFAGGDKAISFKGRSELQSKGENILNALFGLKILLNKFIAQNGSMANVDNEMLNQYIRMFIGRYNSIMGFAYQAMIAHFPDIIVDDLLINFSETGEERVKTKYQRSTPEQTSTTVKTQDIALTASITGNQNSKIGKIIAKFNLPGISVKYSSGVLSGAKQSNIKIKSQDTNLGTLLHDLDNSTLAYIYNIIASYNHKTELIKTNPITRDNYEQMWSALKMAVAINGLVGQASVDDFSYYFIISNKVFTLPEIIRQLVFSFENPDSTLQKIGINGGKTMVLSPTQVQLRKLNEFRYINQKRYATKSVKAAQIRSAQMVHHIAAAKIKAGLSLKIFKLNKNT